MNGDTLVSPRGRGYVERTEMAAIGLGKALGAGWADSVTGIAGRGVSSGSGSGGLVGRPTDVALPFLGTCK